MTSSKEEQILQSLTEQERQFLKQVLEIEMEKLHVKDHDATDDLLSAAKEIIP